MICLSSRFARDVYKRQGVRLRGIGNEDLAAVEEVVVPLIQRRGLRAAGVGSGVGLRKACLLYTSTYAQPRIGGRAFYRCLASPRVVTCGTPQRSEVLPAGRLAQQAKVPSVPAPVSYTHLAAALLLCRA